MNDRAPPGVAIDAFPAADVIATRFELNGKEVTSTSPPIARLADVLRDEMQLTGTKIGCNAGDCGACTLLVDGRQVCACLTALAQVEARRVTTVEGLAARLTRGEPLGTEAPLARAASDAVVAALSALQRSFYVHLAQQCGICTPGMLMAASDLLAREPRPNAAQIEQALGGVLCRCTGYRKIIEAVLAAADDLAAPEWPARGAALGARALKVDAIAKLTGDERFGADDIPANALWLRVVRSPHAHARFSLSDLAPLYAKHAGLVHVLTATDVPSNGFGIYPSIKDQPVLAEGEVRFRGEAIVALLGERATIETIRDDELPIVFEPLPALITLDQAMARNAPRVLPDKPDNLLVEGRVRKGDAANALGACAAVAAGRFTTSFVEHAYIEPEAGWATRRGDRLEIHVTTQTPYMDRNEMAVVLKLAPEQIRIVPTACGGGFGGKLDMSVQPLIGLAAWLLGDPSFCAGVDRAAVTPIDAGADAAPTPIRIDANVDRSALAPMPLDTSGGRMSHRSAPRPVACVYTRPESMMSTTKRHPAQIDVRFGADRDGRLQAVEAFATFNTGAYASWGPTVANRVPIHATGPYRVPHVHAWGKAILTHQMPAGAFRGFGVPQAAIAHEAMLDDLAQTLSLDRWEIRRRNVLKVGDATATGQVLSASCGLGACLDALHPAWLEARTASDAFNAGATSHRRGVGIGCMWYGIGNTSMSNPSTIKVAVSRTGRITLYNGCADMGQGTNTTMLQVCADALGLPISSFGYVMGDTDRTEDAGKSSASRQAFVSGKASELAGLDLRRQILALAGAADDAVITQDSQRLAVEANGKRIWVDLAALEAVDDEGNVLVGVGRFDPPTTPLDDDGQGVPYATYGFAAQIAIAEVDMELGTVRLRKIVAAHDVGRALNPQQVEGQIHGGIAQGIGMALMEEYVPGQTENLHDYLIPSIGDVPPIDVILIEDHEPLGPGGAKGVGEPALIPTPPAILGAIRDATGIRIDRVPITPPRLRALLRASTHFA